jgi:hypothetical protein
MTISPSPISAAPDAEVKVMTEARRIAIKAHLDRLFRQAGDALETRVLYRAILDYRMGRFK